MPPGMKEALGWAPMWTLELVCLINTVTRNYNVTQKIKFYKMATASDSGMKYKSMID